MCLRWTTSIVFNGCVAAAVFVATVTPRFFVGGPLLCCTPSRAASVAPSSLAASLLAADPEDVPREWLSVDEGTGDLGRMSMSSELGSFDHPGPSLQ